jgi:AcrR family transcriptional regulator
MCVQVEGGLAFVPVDVAATAPRRADAERNISAILDAALAGLAEDPNVTMAEIAAAAGVGRRTIYAHFPSREQLIAAVLDRAVADAETVLAAALGDDLPADRALANLVRTSWQTLDRHRALFEVARGVLGHAQLRARHDPALGHFDRLIARGQAEGSFADMPTGWLVTVVFSLLHAAADDVNTHRLAPDDAADLLEATVLAALTSRRPTGRGGGAGPRRDRAW